MSSNCTNLGRYELGIAFALVRHPFASQVDVLYTRLGVGSSLRGLTLQARKAGGAETGKRESKVVAGHHGGLGRRSSLHLESKIHAKVVSTLPYDDMAKA